MFSHFIFLFVLYWSTVNLGFPGGSVVKNPPANVGYMGSIPESEDPLEKKWQPSPVFLPGQSRGQRSLVNYSPWGHKELDAT